MSHVITVQCGCGEPPDGQCESCDGTGEMVVCKVCEVALELRSEKRDGICTVCADLAEAEAEIEAAHGRIQQAELDVPDAPGAA